MPAGKAGLYDPIDLAYAAGIMDGEGSIMLAKKVTHRGTENISPVVVVNMTDKSVPDFLSALFGGMPVTIIRENRNPNWSPIYRWQVTGQRAIAVVRALTPYLKTKLPQAQVLLRFEDEALWVKSGGGIQGNRVPEDELARRRGLKEEMHLLNRRGSVANG